ncbi:MAG TPA: TerC family protein [Myxococcota bacterium]|nr:TerC family protein [Myxococcota bacterium]
MDLLTIDNLVGLVTVTALEIVLGIDNIIFLAIITSRVPVAQQSQTRKIGLALAMIMRIGLLLAISWVVSLTAPLFSIMDKAFSGRDLVMLGGGLFLIAKATFEIHGTIEDHKSDKVPHPAKSIPLVLLQIMMIDIVFSLDSVITAVGMVGEVEIMVAAVVISVAIMMIFANPISLYILRHPTLKMLGLSFLILVGFVLVADGFGKPIEKGYIYFAMGFSFAVEMLNLKLRSKPAQEASEDKWKTKQNGNDLA